MDHCFKPEDKEGMGADNKELWKANNEQMPELEYNKKLNLIIRLIFVLL